MKCLDGGASHAEPQVAKRRKPAIHRVSDHERILRKYFSAFDIPDDCPRVDEPVCILLFTNRSGSSLICEYLRATNRFYGFGEPLNHKLVIRSSEREHITSLADYLRWEMEHLRREGCMFGMKAGYGQAMMLVRSGAIPRFFKDIRWVMVRRKDILAQAISFSIANQTKQWSSKMQGKGQMVEYRFEDIQKRLKGLSRAYDAMNAFCSLQDIEPYRIDYDDFVANPRKGGAQLASYLGVTRVVFDEAVLTMREQRKNMNQEFRDNFVKQYRGPLLDFDSGTSD